MTLNVLEQCYLFFCDTLLISRTLSVVKCWESDYDLVVEVNLKMKMEKYDQ